MTKYIVVEVANREINHLVYDNLDSAKTALCALYDEVCEKYRLDRDDNYVCWIDDDNTVAYVSKKNYQFDWKIIES